MKKLIAISVMFVLIAGAAFAQAVSASVETRMQIARSHTETGEGKAYFGGGVNNGTIAFAGANDDNTYGGVFKLAFLGNDNNGTRDDMTIDSAKFDRAFVWWKPLDILTIKLGHDGDGQFGTTELIRWAHLNMPRNISVERWNQGGYLLGHWDQTGISFAATPIDNLSLNLALGFQGPSEASWADYFATDARLLVQAGYNIAGIGKATLSYLRGKDMWPINSNTGRIGLTFYSDELVEGLRLEAGGNFKLDDGAKDNLRFAVGAHWTGDDLGVKFRTTIEPNSGSNKILLLYVDVMPWYKISDEIGTIYCNIMVSMPSKDVIGWHVNPYLRNSFGAGDWRIGALIEGQAGDAGADGIAWKLATAWVLSF
jgi:opacity protein-like surface antigen